MELENEEYTCIDKEITERDEGLKKNTRKERKIVKLIRK